MFVELSIVHICGQEGTAVVTVDSLDFCRWFVVVGVGYINTSVFHTHYMVDWVTGARLIIARFQSTQRRMDAKMKSRLQTITFIIVPKIKIKIKNVQL